MFTSARQGGTYINHTLKRRICRVVVVKCLTVTERRLSGVWRGFCDIVGHKEELDESVWGGGGVVFFVRMALPRPISVIFWRRGPGNEALASMKG